MISLVVELGERSYPIHVGSGLLQRADLISAALSGGDVMIVTNDNIARLYLESLTRGLGAYRVHSVVLPDGEEFKTLATLNRIYDRLLENHFSRDCTLIALGGGVIGDLTGFAAASYQRGVDFIQIPTTLLAQVDSSVGGKTGVNHVLGKNMIGAFHQPRCVIADTATLDTLDDRELRAGLAEVIKYGLVCDPPFFAWLEEHLEGLLSRDVEALTYAIKRSCEIKADVVSRDERETGARTLLNLGHTFGHAIEADLGYGKWLHGEAVAAGMRLAADLSARLAWIDQAQLRRIDTLLQRTGLPTELPAQVKPERLLELMRLDKKVVGGTIRLVLLRGIGEAVLTTDYQPGLIHETLSHCRSAA